jgi:hypothetical protein
MTNSKIIKAVRAPITLGDTELDVYQLPDSSYGYEYIWLAELIQRDKQILSNKKSPYALQNILGKDKTNWNTKVNGISLDYTLNSVTESIITRYKTSVYSPGATGVFYCYLRYIENKQAQEAKQNDNNKNFKRRDST